MWYKKAEPVYHGYHGTNEPNLSWETLEPNDPNYHGSLGHGIYMGAERSTAEGYGEYVHEGDVRMDNPLVIDAHESINHNYLTPSVYDEAWKPYRVTDDNTGEVLYEGDDEDHARAMEESHPHATFTNKYDTDEFVPESVLMGERISPFEVLIGGKWHRILSPSDFISINEYARMLGHDGIVMRGVRDDGSEEMIAFDKSQMIPNNPLQ